MNYYETMKPIKIYGLKKFEKYLTIEGVNDEQKQLFMNCLIDYSLFGLRQPYMTQKGFTIRAKAALKKLSYFNKSNNLYFARATFDKFMSRNELENKLKLITTQLEKCLGNFKYCIFINALTDVHYEIYMIIDVANISINEEYLKISLKDSIFDVFNIVTKRIYNLNKFINYILHKQTKKDFYYYEKAKIFWFSENYKEVLNYQKQGISEYLKLTKKCI